ncbi:aspartate aminotransferase family protein [Pseudomonas sp. NPDC089392]|uniref:aspartate aminotransferase family protein n=1 Tax=Pseudomonas sp. NPDC089392 TaxID=3364459 RepID=UPI00381A152F
MSDFDSLAHRDVANQIHPYTNLAQHQESGPLIIERGNGIRVVDSAGRAYIEAMSGLWSVGLGFSEQRLVDAATRQFQKLPYYHSFSHKAHSPSIELASRLVGLTPDNLNHVHFTNSGSEANDAAIKIVWYVNNALGRSAKKKIIARKQGYHGATIASGSLTGIPSIHQDFDLPAIPVRHITCPYYYRHAHPGETEADFSRRLALELEELILSEGADTIAAFIGEPLIAAGGVIPAPEGYWQEIQRVCKRYDVLVIADEIITGFGRLGVMFGADYYGIQPDIMVLSKQLTSSYQPLAAILVSSEINEVLVNQSARLGSFVHGFTTTGHPVATAVALENIKIIEERGLVENARVVGSKLQAELRHLSDHPLVGDVRGAGLVAGVELVADKVSKKQFDRAGELGAYIFRRAHDYGLIIRAIGDTIAFCPPLISTQADIDQILSAFEHTLRDATSWANAQGLH